MKRFGEHRWLLFKASVILLLAAAVSAMFNERQKRLQYHKYSQIGRSVDIGGRNLNIYCSGEGSPAVVFETFAHQALELERRPGRGGEIHTCLLV